MALEDPRCRYCGKSSNIYKNQRSNIARNPFCAFSSCYAKYVYYEQTVRQAFANLTQMYSEQILALRNEFEDQFYQENFDRLVTYAHDWMVEKCPEQIEILRKHLNTVEIDMPAIPN